MTTQTTEEPELTKGQFIAHRIRYLITMMSDAQRDDIKFINYNPQDEVEKTEREIAEAIDVPKTDSQTTDEPSLRERYLARPWTQRDTLEELATAHELCEIYREIAVEAIGVDELCKQRDAKLNERQAQHE